MALQRLLIQKLLGPHYIVDAGLDTLTTRRFQLSHSGLQFSWVLMVGGDTSRPYGGRNALKEKE